MHKQWVFYTDRHELVLSDGNRASLRCGRDLPAYLSIMPITGGTPRNPPRLVGDVFRDSEGQIYSTVNPDGLLPYRTELTTAEGLTRHGKAVLTSLLDAVESAEYIMVETLPSYF